MMFHNVSFGVGKLAEDREDPYGEDELVPNRGICYMGDIKLYEQ